MLSVVLLLTLPTAIAHTSTFAGTHPFIFIVKPTFFICALFELFATGSANSYILRQVQIGIFDLRVLVGPSSEEDKSESQMRVDDLHFSVGFSHGFAEIHDCSFDGPSFVDSETKGKLETANLFCAKVSEKGVELSILELYLEAMFDGSHV